MPANDPLWTAPSAGSQIQATDELMEVYFRHISPEDQRELGEDGRKAMVQSHLELAVEARGEPTIGILRQPRHAVVQVVHLDIRFLVEYVSAVLTYMDVLLLVIVHLVMLETR